MGSEAPGPSSSAGLAGTPAEEADAPASGGAPSPPDRDYPSLDLAFDVVAQRREFAAQFQPQAIEVAARRRFRVGGDGRHGAILAPSRRATVPWSEPGAVNSRRRASWVATWPRGRVSDTRPRRYSVSTSGALRVRRRGTLCWRSRGANPRRPSREGETREGLPLRLFPPAPPTLLHEHVGGASRPTTWYTVLAEPGALIPGGRRGSFGEPTRAPAQAVSASAPDVTA